MRRNFISFEGGEGAGKSTQANILAEKLKSIGRRVLVTREPGGSSLAERMRKFLLSPDRPTLNSDDEAMLFAIARADHMAKVIVPALDRGEIVICDRFSDSTMAYQGFYIDKEFFDDLYRESVGFDGPRLTFVFDLDPVLGLSRALARRAGAAVDRFESFDLQFHVALRERFLAIARENPKRCVVVDASKSVDVIAKEIWEVAENRLNS